MIDCEQVKLDSVLVWEFTTAACDLFFGIQPDIYIKAETPSENFRSPSEKGNLTLHVLIPLSGMHTMTLS